MRPSAQKPVCAPLAHWDDTLDVALVWPGVTLVAALWIWLCVRNPGVATAAVVAAAVSSAHVFALLYATGVDAAVVRNLIPLKDVAAVLLGAALLARELRSDRSSRWLWLPTALLAVACIPALLHGLADQPGGDVLLSTRNALLPFLAATTGLLLHGKDRRRAVIGSVVVISVAAAYALVEYFLPVSFLTDVIRVGDYWVNVKKQPFLMSPLGTGLPGNFFTSSGSRRISGSYGDPLAAGYALAAGVVLALTLHAKRARVVLLAVLSCALVLSFTRAGILIALGAAAPLAVRTYIHSSIRQRFWSVIGLLGALAAILLLTPVGKYLETVLSGNDGSTRAHIDALLSLDDHEYSVTGSGFGAVGAAVGLGTENVLVTVAVQLGLAGLVLYFVALTYLARRGGERWGVEGLRAVYVGAWIALVVSMAISEQLLTFNAGYVVLLALFLGPSATSLGIACTGNSCQSSAVEDQSSAQRQEGSAPPPG